MTQTKTKSTSETKVNVATDSRANHPTKDVKSTDNSSACTGSEAGFKVFLSGLLFSEQVEEAISILNQSSLDSKEIEDRIAALEIKRDEIQQDMYFCKTFVGKPKEYLGHLIELTAQYDELIRGLVAHISGKNEAWTVNTGCFNVADAFTKAFQSVDSFLSVPSSRDDDARVFAARLNEGDTVWLSGREGKITGFDNTTVYVLMEDSKVIESIYALDLSLEAPKKQRDLREQEKQILSLLQIHQKLSAIELADKLDIGELAVKGYAKNLLQDGLIESTEEDDETYYSLQSVATALCNELEEIERQWTHKPSLSATAKTAMFLAAGGGGGMSGAVAAGIRPVVAVECDPDPKKQALSGRLADALEANFTEYGTQVIRKSVQQLAAEKWEGLPEAVDILDFSLPCCNFSEANSVGVGASLETEDDIEAAKAAASAIARFQPSIVCLENVSNYIHSQSFIVITSKLEELGYFVDFKVHKLSHFGKPHALPQDRERLTLWACKTKLLALPNPHPDRRSWHSAIAHLIDELPTSTLTTGQKAHLADWKDRNRKPKYPLLITRVGQISVSQPHECANTLTRSIFTDGKQCNRTKVADILFEDGSCKSLTIQAFAILQGFPAWYQFPEAAGDAGSIIGYSVPPSVSYHFYSHFLSQMNEEDWNVRVEHPVPFADESFEVAEVEVVEEEYELPAEKEQEFYSHLATRVCDYRLGDKLTDAQALSIVDEINKSSEELEQIANWLRFCIKVLDEGKGYEALGFSSMSQLFSSGVLKKSRSTCQKEWQTHVVEKALGLPTGELAQVQGMKLFPVASKHPDKVEDVWSTARQLADEDGGTMKAKHIADAIANHNLLPTPKPKKRFVLNEGGGYSYSLNFCGEKIDIKDHYADQMQGLNEVAEEEGKTPEAVITSEAIDLIMELMPELSSRQAAIAFLAERATNKARQQDVV